MPDLVSRKWSGAGHCDEDVTGLVEELEDSVLATVDPPAEQQRWREVFAHVPVRWAPRMPREA